MTRDDLGRLVRNEWMVWAWAQPDPKPSWLVPYDDLSEPDKEADRRIGEGVWRHARLAVQRAFVEDCQERHPGVRDPWLHVSDDGARIWLTDGEHGPVLAAAPLPPALAGDP